MPRLQDLMLSIPSRRRDAVVVGAGHNGLVAAAYLARQGWDVLVLERRHCIGGAAVTEEVIPGFRFSRASYLAGLLRPHIVRDLDLKKHGLEFLHRDPSSFTPTADGSGRSLLLGSSQNDNWKSISQFSVKDADAFPKYEDFLHRVRDIIQPFLDTPPVNPFQGSLRRRSCEAKIMFDLAKKMLRNQDLYRFYQLFCAPASVILNQWFESELLKATLATDSVIGSLCSPTSPASGYVLLHHVMGSIDGREGCWAYVKGGMGALSESIARSAVSSGAEIVTGAQVSKIVLSEDKCQAIGVKLGDGTFIPANVIVSNATPYTTFCSLLEEDGLPRDFVQHIRQVDYSCGALKINCAVNQLPSFTCLDGNAQIPRPEFHGTIHFSQSIAEIVQAYHMAAQGYPARVPVIEMTLPSVLDDSLAPSGKHVCQLFVQFAPYSLQQGSWSDEGFKARYVSQILSVIEQFCPGFGSSVIGTDVLSPVDLEAIFGLHRGNIFHGALSLHQIGHLRPAPGFSRHKSPIPNLYLAGSGAHPGGGVSGAPGHNCAQEILQEYQ